MEKQQQAVVGCVLVMLDRTHRVAGRIVTVAVFKVVQERRESSGMCAADYSHVQDSSCCCYTHDSSFLGHASRIKPARAYVIVMC
ncbi:hypothetical protein L2E82_19205 [Cichorium intybus]|uniref:Uncharacterized protein n=1 Tax=Cichorium intybus TaxID=13427 RepID=A0ACB9FCA1_CICIN|nr:hypothetical protein L2E82_19205 [Cichorium intybus]